MSFEYLIDPENGPQWESARMMGVLFIPDFPRMQAAARQHNMQFMPDSDWEGASE